MSEVLDSADPRVSVLIDYARSTWPFRSCRRPSGLPGRNMSRISPQRRPLDDDARERQRILGEAAKKIEIAQQDMANAKETAKQVEAAARTEALRKLEAANQAFNQIREKERQEEEEQQAREEAARKKFLPPIVLTISSTHNQEDEKGQIFTVYIISVASPTNAFVPWHVGRRFIEFCQLDDVVGVLLAVFDATNKSI